jgi:hypothetical protein
VLRQSFLVGRQKADAERLGPAKQLVQGRLPADAHRKEGRLEREGDDRADCQTEALALDVDADHRHRGGHASHERAQVVAAGHELIIGARRAATWPGTCCR